MSGDPQRSDAFARNRDLEGRLTVLNSLLLPVQRVAEAGLDTPPLPTVFVIGPPRSGTTLLVQWLAASGVFAYPTNLLSRFYAAPLIGALVQDIITDPKYDYRGELADLQPSKTDFESDAGKTRGALSPNEFWYWWRQFLPHSEISRISPAQERQIDVLGLRRGMAAIQSVWPKPFVTKGKLLQYNLECLLRVFPRSLVLYSHRHPLYNMQSLLLTRERYFGNRGAWFSSKPPGHEAFVDSSPEEQVAAQVHLANHAIRQQFPALNDANYLDLAHEGFCADPAVAHDTIMQRLSRLGYEREHPYQGPRRFALRNAVKVTGDAARRIRAAYVAVSGEEADWEAGPT